MMNRRHALLAGAAAVAGGTLAAAALRRKPPEVLVLGEPAAPRPQPLGSIVEQDPPRIPAEASFTDEAGAPATLASFAGKGLVVNLWATWCAPCVAEMPALQALARIVAAEGILVLPVSSDRGGAEVVRQFYAAHDITALPVWLDPKGEAGRAWGARGLPTTLLIDRQGRERARLEGAADWASPDTVAAVRRLTG
ncbi:MAG TPA: TlpA disulfide reductase family protein [Acetobacteraceae bacterium]